MLHLKIVSGTQAGREFTARRFPFQIGRSPLAALPLEDAGVWERHCEIRLDPAQRFLLRSQDEALMVVNGEPVREIRLRNGDVIELGSARLQVWLAPARQRSLRLREAVTWAGLAMLFAAQISLIYWLLG